jgi:hypothetical protein
MVCGGEKTEPKYFEEIRQNSRLSSTYVHIVPSDLATNPMNVVRCAEKVFLTTGGAFERVYATETITRTTLQRLIGKLLRSLFYGWTQKWGKSVKIRERLNRRKSLI